MKIAILGDPHFGHSSNCGHINPRTGLHTRLEDFCDTFQQAIDYCKENPIRLLILLGDIYKNNQPTMTQQREFAKKLRLLQESLIPVLIIKGNHDITVNLNTAHTTAPLQELLVQGITIVDEPKMVQFEDLSIICMPYQSRARIGVQDNKQLLEYYSERVQYLSKQATGTKIFIGHQTPEGAIPPQHQIDLTNSGEFVVPLKLLENFDASFFGHIHKIQKLSKKLPIWVCGSMDRIDFAEAKEEKGLFIYNTDTKDIKVHPLKVRDFIPIEIDVTKIPSDEIAETIIKEINDKKIENTVVKLIIKIQETDRKYINYAQIKTALINAHHVIEPDIQIERTTRLRNQKVNEKLSSIEALQEYFKDRDDLNDQIKKKIILRGLQIIKFQDSSGVL